jgi:hypothetical protein
MKLGRSGDRLLACQNFHQVVVMRKSIVAIIALLTLASSSAFAVDVFIHTSDFINNSDRTNFNSFENLPDVGTPPINSQGVWIFNDPSEATYEEDGIVVTQIFDEFAPGAAWSGVWTTHFPADGIRDWYPNGGDDGYTVLEIELSSIPEPSSLVILFGIALVVAAFHRRSQKERR